MPLKSFKLFFSINKSKSQKNYTGVGTLKGLYVHGKMLIMGKFRGKIINQVRCSFYIFSIKTHVRCSFT